jgi:MTH538 TIR-like domain (DUF1863)
MRTPNIFISHQWKYSYEYYALIEKFSSLDWNHVDYSVPQHDSFDLTRKKQITDALREQVRQCNFFIVVARMASGNSEWIQKEIEFAAGWNKPILGVKPLGYTGNIPTIISDNVTFPIAGFNTPAIIRTIERTLS